MGPRGRLKTRIGRPPGGSGNLLTDFLAYAEEADRLRHLTIRGIESLSRQDRLAEAVAKLEAIDSQDESWSADDDPYVQQARTIAKMAEEELQGEFPLVNAHTLVGLWGAFEAAIDDLVVTWFVNEPNRLKHERLRRIKVSVELLVSDSEDRARFIVLEYLRSVGGDLKVGIGRSESLLELIDLTGPIDDDLRRTLLETQQVRNLYAHRGESWTRDSRKGARGSRWLWDSAFESTTPCSTATMSQFMTMSS